GLGGESEREGDEQPRTREHAGETRMLLRASGVALARMLDRGIRGRNRRQLAGQLHVPGRLAPRGVERRKGNRCRVEGEEFGLVATGAGKTLGVCGGDERTGRRGESSEEWSTHSGRLRGSPAAK